MTIQNISLIQCDRDTTDSQMTSSLQCTTASVERILSTASSSFQSTENSSSTPLSSLQETTVAGHSPDKHSSEQDLLGSRSYILMQMSPMKKNCTTRCPCQCHTQFQRSTPSWLRGLLGAMFFNFTGTPLPNHRPCSLTSCGSDVNS
jgi:hypothetical protein